MSIIIVSSHNDNNHHTNNNNQERKEVNMVLNVHRNHKANWGRGEVWGGGGHRGGGRVRVRLYTYHYTVTTRMTSALSWAAMRAILMFHNCDGQSHKTVQCP